MENNQSTDELFGQMIIGSWVTQAIYVAAELGIADLLSEGPKTADELAKLSNSHTGALYRLLRALSSAGIFSIDTEQKFSLTPLSEYLRSDRSGSKRAYTRMLGSELYQAWANLLHSVHTGEQAFMYTFGKPIFTYLTENPDRGKVFDAAMSGVHGGETKPMLDAYDFSQFNTIVDVGGGNGHVLAAILKHIPDLSGVLFDLPFVAGRTRENIEREGLDNRCRVVSGDFFKSMEPGGDAYIMRHIIHDWDDESAVKILTNCRKAMNPGGKILIAETVIPEGNVPNFGKWLDLMMLVVGGKERTELQYRQLLGQSGLRLEKIVVTSSEISIIEAVSQDQN